MRRPRATAAFPLEFRWLVCYASAMVQRVQTGLAAPRMPVGAGRVRGTRRVVSDLHARENGVPVQRVDHTKLRARLLVDRQVLDWTVAGP